MIDSRTFTLSSSSEQTVAIFSHTQVDFFFLSLFFFVCMHLLLLKRLKDFIFFQSKLSGLSENRTFHKANFPWCSGNIITPKHHSFSMTYGFIYKKKTSLTPINTKYSHSCTSLSTHTHVGAYVVFSSTFWIKLRKKFDTNKCRVTVSLSASLSIWQIIL